MFMLLLIKPNKFKTNMNEHQPSPAAATIDQATPESNFTQEVCDVVAEDIGNPPDQSLFLEFSDVLAEQAEQQATDLEAAALYNNGDYDPTDLRTGEAAVRAQKTLGCLGCLLSEQCHLKVAIDKKIAAGEENRKLDMIASAPAWLTAGRLARSGVDEKELTEQLKDRESAKQARADGSLDIDGLLGGVTNELAGEVVTRNDLPELENFSAIDQDALLQPQLITTETGNKYVVVDASNATSFNGPKPTVGDYKILSSKLLGRMIENDAQGNPHVLTADRTMQKPIRRLDKSHVDEFRMNGKSRFYAVIVPSPKGQPDIAARITILGAHGGDEKTQQSFISTIIPNK